MLDAASQALLAALAQAAGPDPTPIWEMSVAEARASSARLRALYGAGPEVRSSTDVQIPAHDGGSFRARILVPTEEPTAVVLYLHGGGWTVEDVDGFDTLGRHLAQKSGAVVVLAEYRKAPEHPFPDPVEDAWTALQWTAAHAAELAGREVPLFAAGDSAGGNLAAVVARWARERGAPSLAGQILVYPATDGDLTRPSYLEAANQTLLTTPAVEWFLGQYVPDPADRVNPDFAPLRAESLAGLAPALVITGEHDVLRDEGDAYAERLRREGVVVDHRRWPGQMHGFFTLSNVLPAGAEAMDLIAAKIRAGRVA
jgi:acetyl esterase